MSDHGSEARASSLQRINAALLAARRDLIDTSRRNRLLHSTRTGKRPHCLEIIGIDPDDLVGSLTRRRTQFVFAASLEAEDNRGAHEAVQRAPRLQTLQTKLGQEALERRLIKFFREARTLEEEQGINILFLAIGFLHWFEDDHSQEPNSAPLLLVPISLERRQGHDPFVMRGRDDDMIVNVSLAEKLRGYGIALPDLPEGDEWRASDYFAAVANAVVGQRRWTIEETGAGLGFFTFSKFLMWRDLDATAWPDASGLLNNLLVARLLGEDPTGEPDAPLASDEEPIDGHVDL